MRSFHFKRIGLLLAAQWACLSLPMVLNPLPNAESLQFLFIIVIVSSFVVPLIGYSYLLFHLPAFSRMSPLIKFPAIVAAALMMTLAGYFVMFAFLLNMAGPLVPSN